jgi:hypothetical protein
VTAEQWFRHDRLGRGLQSQSLSNKVCSALYVIYS